MSGEVQPRPRTPSVAELQAALMAAQRGDFASASAPRPVPPAAEVPPRTGSSLRLRRHSQPPIRVARPAAGMAPGRRVLLLGTHGGSGASCLAAVLPAAELADKAYSCRRGEPVVLVCRATHRGLSSAQDHAREHRDGDCGEGQPLLGLVVVAATPGRTPGSLRRLEQLVSGAVPILGRVPWVDEWRVGPARAWQQSPAWLSALTASLASAQLVGSA